ncbi:Cyclic nucleotide-gated ion channel 1 [Asimina triloba]
MRAFQDWSSEKSSPFGRSFSSEDGLLSGKVGQRIINSLSTRIRRSFEYGSDGIRNIRKSLQFRSLKSSSMKDLGSRKILDPQGEFLQKWNKIFVLSCVIAVSMDPLFLYIPVVKDNLKCLDLDSKLGIVASVLRTFTDVFYILHILFQFRTGFIAPTSRVFGRGVLVEDRAAIARRYLLSYFLIDILSLLPIPQFVILIIIPKLKEEAPLNAKRLLQLVVLLQYVPRLVRIIPLYREVTRSAGIITETAWAGAVFNLLLYMLASHIIGAFWYLIAIDRQDTCWRNACNRHKPQCSVLSLYCGGTDVGKNAQLLNSSCPINADDQNPPFDFGIFLPALTSETYLQSTTVRLEEMRVKKRDAEQWMSHRLLPDNLRGRIRRHEQYKWQETRGVDEEHLLFNLPKDLRRDIKRHLCLALLMRVPMFEKMDEQLLDAMCDRLKPALYTEESCIVREGDPVDEMLFIMRGRLESVTTNGGRTGFFNSDFLKAGDFCGEELLTWALDPHSSSNLATSTRTVRTISEVEAFALKADDLKFVASQFRRLHSKQLQHTFRFYSTQWRTWAACFIQAAWRRYCKKKLEESLREEENRLQAALAKGSANSPSLGATIYASRFAANALRALRRNRTRRARVPERLPPMLLQKPTEPDFTVDNDR